MNNLFEIKNLHLWVDIFNFFSYKPRVLHGAIAVQPLRGWQNKTPTGFNRNSPTLQRGDNKRIKASFVNHQ